nr:PH domain-containing protein [Sphingomonas colocasiae]
MASDIGWRYFLPIAAGSLALSGLVRWVAWRCFRYGVGSGELVIEQGLIQRSRRTIPFDRIQDVDFEQGPLHRIFGLVRLRFETGGQGADEGVLDSVMVAEAERIRAAVRGAPRAIASDETAPAAAPLFIMPLGRVILSGLFNFSLLWIAGIFAVLQSASDWLPFDVRDIGAWIGLAERNLAGRVTPGAIAGVLLLAIMLGLASGVVKTLMRDFGFRLTRERTGFRCERGLLTRRDMLIPRTRIQLGQLLSGPVRRAAGFQTLAFQTLGMGEGEDGGGSQDAAPFARSDEIAAILAETGRLRLPGDARLIRVSRRHVWKALLPAAVILSVFVVVATMFDPRLILTGLAVPALLAFMLAERRSHRYVLDRDLLFIQAGFWRRALWILPIANIQTFGLRRNWLQRRLGLSTLIFDTAGAASGCGAAIRDLRNDLADALLHDVTERNRNGRVSRA